MVSAGARRWASSTPGSAASQTAAEVAAAAKGAAKVAKPAAEVSAASLKTAAKASVTAAETAVKASTSAAESTVAAAVRRPKKVGAFRGGFAGFLAGTVLTGFGAYYYLVEEYRVANTVVVGDVIALNSSIQKLEAHVKALEVKLEKK